MIKFTNGYILSKDFELIKDDVYVKGDSIYKIGKCDAVSYTHLTLPTTSRV